MRTPGTSRELLERVRLTNSQLDQLTTGLDARDRLNRSLRQARDLRQALASLQRALEGAQELRTSADVHLDLPLIDPPPADASPLEWFDSGSGIEYVKNVDEEASNLSEAVREAWSDFLTDLAPSLLDPSLIQRLRGTTEQLDRACDELAQATELWKQLPSTMPTIGDAQSAKEIKNAIDAAWQLLGNSGATAERIEFLERVGRGQVPFSVLDDDLVDWLRRTGIAAQLFVVSGT